MRLILAAALAAVVCGKDDPMYTAKVGEKFVIADAELTFQIHYNMTAGNGTKEGLNSALTVPKDAVATAELKNNGSALDFTLSWGPNKAQESKLTFSMTVTANETMLEMVNLSTWTTAEFGFANASKDENLNLKFPVDGFSWGNSGGFKCTAKTALSSEFVGAGKDSGTLANFRVQAFQGRSFGANFSECAADAGSTTTPRPTTTTTAPPAPINTYALPPTGPTKCLLLKSAINFAITYKAANKTGNETTYKDVSIAGEVPAKGVTVEGSCSELNGTEQSLTLSFNKTWALTLYVSDDKKFTKAASDGASYAVYKVHLFGDLPDHAVAKGINLTNQVDDKGNGALERFLVGSANKSVSCGSYKHQFGAVDKDNVSVTVTMSDVQFEAFAESNGTFSASEPCVAPAGSSDLIPIIVGACLAALVVIVLVAYLIGRARARRGGYQSV